VDDEAVNEQARTILEDVTAQVIKIGFCGSPESLSAIAGDLCRLCGRSVMHADLSWWDEVQIDLYLDAFRELMCLRRPPCWLETTSTLWY
jgi:hydroxymethylpyrimidine/phosphomethylpyrimidine kinase